MHALGGAGEAFALASDAVANARDLRNHYHRHTVMERTLAHYTAIASAADAEHLQFPVPERRTDPPPQRSAASSDRQPAPDTAETETPATGPNRSPPQLTDPVAVPRYRRSAERAARQPVPCAPEP